MLEPKYIVVKNRHGMEGIIVFSPWLEHRDVAGTMGPDSAGFIMGGEKPYVHGDSQSLKLMPKHDRDNVLLKQLVKHLTSDEY